jgi:hypothetical protein
VFEPTLEHLGEVTAVGARVGDEDALTRRFHSVDDQTSRTSAQADMVGRPGEAAPIDK